MRASSAPLRRVPTVALAVLALLLIAGPAAADPAGPTHYDSIVTEVRAADGDPVPIEVEILGGDAFLVLRAAPGTEVLVPGYEGEPYIQIRPDGEVLVNERSPARWLNDARYGEAEIEVPPQADATAPPAFTTVANGGEFAWHDHRIHFMSPALPPQVDPGAGTVQDVWEWTVPLTVDGRDVEILGVLTWVPGPPPAVPIGLTVLVVAAAVALVARRPRWVTPVIAGAAVAAAGIGLTKVVGLPAGADGEPMLLILPGLTAALLAVGVLLTRRRGGDTRGVLIAAAAGLPLVVWAVLQIGSLTRPIVPGPLPVDLVRVVVAVTLAAGVAGLVAAGKALLAATSLDAEPTAA